MREDDLLEGLDTGHDHVAFLIGEGSVVFMRALSEIVTGMLQTLGLPVAG